MIHLPRDVSQKHPLWRILVLPPDRWRDAQQPWEPLPMRWRFRVFGVAAGYEFGGAKRLALPDLGQAQFAYHYGRIDDRLYGVDTAGGARDLDGYAVRVQVAHPPATPTTPIAWKTRWLGRVLYQEDEAAPAADYPSGRRIYHCEDLLGVTRDWPIAWHGYHFASLGASGRCRGHPGFNVQREDGALLGNRGTETIAPTDDLPSEAIAAARVHRIAGASAAFWTDRQALNQALVFSRPAGAPLFLIENSTLLAGVEAWPVRDGDRVLGLLRQVLRRSRGRGCAFLDWTESDPDGNLDLVIRVRPQSLASTTYDDPVSGLPISIIGAEDLGTAIDLDLEGDSRLVDGSYRLGERGQERVDYLQTPGAQIEVTVTLSRGDGTIEDKWTSSEASAFLALAPLERMSASADHIYHLYGLKDDFRFIVGDGNNGEFQVCDFRCVNGNFGVPSSSVVPDTSLATAGILRDTCLPRLPMGRAGRLRSPARVFLRVGEDRWIDGRTHDPLTFELRDDGIWLAKSDWDDGDLGGLRYVGDPAEDTLQSRYHRDDVAFTVTLQLPHRVSFETGDPLGARRLLLPPDPRYQLWLVASNAITELGAGDLIGGFAPIRDSAGEPGPFFLPARILRDHRGQLAYRHQLAWSWYSAARKTLRYSIEACPFLPDFISLDADGEPQSVPYPQLGQVIRTVRAGGAVHQVETPVTGIAYDNTSGIGSIETDWSDLDFGSSR